MFTAGPPLSFCSRRIADGLGGPNPGSVSGEAKGEDGGEARGPEPTRREARDLGGGSEVEHIPRFMAWEAFEELHKRIPGTRNTIRVFGHSVVQPRDTCYVADEGLADLRYSGHQAH